MCGIAGIVGTKVNDHIIDNMLSTMHRRGPDGSGVYSGKNCTLLHTRLAIIDPEGGKQPMKIHRGEETYVISYNGELYNTLEIRNELSRYGHEFATQSDTEVILRAFIQWRDGCLKKFNGIFSFIVWLEKEQSLFMARDRMGVKPLFYSIKNETLVVASEIKTILEYPLIKRSVGAAGVSQLMLLGPGKIPGRTVFEDVLELEPGCYAWFVHGKQIKERYWRLKDIENRDSFEETAEKVRFLTLDAIKRQMISDVPIGTFLSGGLDSSLISAVCAAEQSEPLETFSVGYRDNAKYFIAGKFQPSQDDEYISIMSDNICSNHHHTVLTPEDLLDSLNGATMARDVPGMADVDFSLFAFCKDVKSRVKVALSGECADEMFGGYPWFRDPEIRNSEGFPWSQNLQYRSGFINEDWQYDTEYVLELYRDTVRSCDILPGTDPVDRRTKEMAVLNMDWFMQTLLERKDRMSMYHGLEVRVPFCDHRLAEYLYTVPWRYKDHNGREKGLLRYAMKGILPDEVLWRKKSPYPKTHDPHYCDLVVSAMRDIITVPESPLFQIVRREKVLELLDNEYPWPWYGQLMTRPQTIAYFLQIDFWMRHYNVTLI